MVTEITVDWTTVSGGDKFTNLYFEDGILLSGVRAAIDAMFQSMASVFATTTSWNVRGEGRVLNTQTGTLLALWSEPTLQTGTGSDPTTAVADAAQALIRWRTSTIIGGRLVQGRTFLPGLSSNEIAEGNLGLGAQGTIQAAASAFAVDVPELVIWHRPKNGVGGATAPVTSAAVWSEWAVLRHRRG